MSTTGLERGVTAVNAPRRGVRLFAASVEEPRARRAGDVSILIVAVGALFLLSVIALPPAGFEQTLESFIAHLPHAFDGLWRSIVDLVGLASAALIVATAVRRRISLLRDLALSVVIAFVLALTFGRVVQGSWPSAWDSLRNARAIPPDLGFPSLRLALPSAAVLAVLPHLSKPIRRLGRWMLALAAFAIVALGAATAPSAAAGVFVAVASAAIVHLIFGSCRGRPTLADVSRALDGLGFGVEVLGAADRQPTGLFLVHARDRDGRDLVVKVYGRDAYDTQLLTTLFRTVWLREAGAPTTAGRLQQAEHEAFLTLLAEQAGIRTQEVVTAGRTIDNDVLLVLRRLGAPLSEARDRELPDPWSPELVERIWGTLKTLHDAGIAHGQVDDQHLVIAGDEVGLVDFRGATVTPRPERMRTDEAQALVATAIGIGLEPALATARSVLGPDGLAAVLPFVQMTALTPEQRAAIKEAGLKLDDLRARAAAIAEIEAPPLQQLRRVTIGSAFRVILLLIVFFVLASAVAGLDLNQLGDELRNATWALVVVGFSIAQLPRFTQALSTLGASSTPLPLGPVYALQLAMQYIGLALPSTVARVAVNVRFLQHFGLPTGSALAIGALDGAAGFVVQASLLIIVLVFTPHSLSIHLDSSTTSGLARLLLIILGLVAAAIVILFCIKRLRRIILGWIRQIATEALSALRGLQSPRRLALLIGGNLATELLWVTSIGVLALAFGYRVGLAELLLINLSVGLLSGVVPIPGGIGVVEGGLTFGLVRAGIPEETAFAIVIIYRLATTYVPPLWGYFSLQWLRRNQYL